MKKMLVAIACLGMIGSANISADIIEDILKSADTVDVLLKDQLTVNVINKQISQPLTQATKVVSDPKSTLLIKIDAVPMLYEPLMLINGIVVNISTLIDMVGKALANFPGARRSAIIAKGNTFGKKLQELAKKGEHLSSAMQRQVEITVAELIRKNGMGQMAIYRNPHHHEDGICTCVDCLASIRTR